MDDSSQSLSSLDPRQLFALGPIVSDENEFGTLISAQVAEEYVELIGFPLVLVRILPIGASDISALRSVVRDVSKSCSGSSVLRYVGVWEVSQNEAWLVSERRRQVCIQDLFTTIQSQDVESIIAFVAYKVLQVLQSLHEVHRQAHNYLRPESIYFDDDGNVCVGDIGIYRVLYEALRARRSMPGRKLWPLPRSAEGPVSLFHSDIWDLGICLLVLVDGGANVGRLRRTGRRLPRLNNPSKWSAQFNNFLSLMFARASDFLSLASELLEHRFVSEASFTACKAAIDEYNRTGEELIKGQYINDTISTIFRQNAAVVRAPLISIDDISTDYFTYEQWKAFDQNRPTVEMSFVRILRNCAAQPYPKDTEEGKSRSRTVETLESFLETADMQ